MLSITSYGQTEIEAKDLTKKELRELKKQKAFEKQKDRYAKRGLNAWGINENAPNLVLAIREHLGSARIDTQRGLVIIRQSESFSNSQAYPLWIVDGQQYSKCSNIPFFLFLMGKGVTARFLTSKMGRSAVLNSS